MRMFVDMDGVLADFDSHHEAVFGVRADKRYDNVDWEKVRAHRGFYAGIPPMADMRELWAYIERYNPTILTGVPESVEEARDNKVAWAARWLPGVPVIGTRSSKKFMYAHPGDVLIDDWEKYKSKWTGAGGIWVTHTSARETIRSLKELGL